MGQIEQSARISVHQEYTAAVASGQYGTVPRLKPDDTIRMMYKNFSSLSLFSIGPRKHAKIRQLNKIIRDYGVDVLSGCETRTDWQFVSDEDSKFENLFENGQPTRGICAHNRNDPKIKRDQWGGTCVTTIGRFSSFIIATGTDTTGLGRWSWVYVGGGGKFTQIAMVYQPVKPGCKTRGETVWDQHARLFISRGEIRNPRAMFKVDLCILLQQWKANGDEIILFGDFNEDIYLGELSL